jgi:hypothetical protein
MFHDFFTIQLSWHLEKYPCFVARPALWISLKRWVPLASPWRGLMVPRGFWRRDGPPRAESSRMMEISWMTNKESQQSRGI